MLTRGNRRRRAALVLALLVLAAIVTGVTASAAKTVVPNQLIGNWDGPQQMVIGPRGKVEIKKHVGWYHARFSQIAAHEKHREWVGRLSISGIRSCSGTGTYRWKITNRGSISGGRTYVLKFTEIQDECEPRVNLLAPVNMVAPADESWWRHTSQP
jgi:hypothetical protein